MREKHQVFPVQVQHSGSSANKFLYKLPEFKFQHGYALLDSDWMSSQMSAGALGLVAGKYAF